MALSITSQTHHWQIDASLSAWRRDRSKRRVIIEQQYCSTDCNVHYYFYIENIVNE